MMGHVDRAIAQYFEGRITRASDRDALFGHLHRCDACRRSFDERAVAERALAGLATGQPPPGGPSARELDAIASALLDAVAPRQSRAWWRWLAGAAIPVVASLLVAVALPDEAFRSKGGGPAGGVPVIEVLCFDARAEVVAHLKESGACPAPGFLKVIFASPRPIEHLSVAAFTRDEVRLSADLTTPEPRSVLADYAQLGPGETVRVVARPGAVSVDALRSLPADLSVTGVAR